MATYNSINQNKYNSKWIFLKTKRLTCWSCIKHHNGMIFVHHDDDFFFFFMMMIMAHVVCYLLYSCGYGEEYHVCISYFPNSITDGHRIWGSGGPVTPTFYKSSSTRKLRKKETSGHTQFRDYWATMAPRASCHTQKRTKSLFYTRLWLLF